MYLINNHSPKLVRFCLEKVSIQLLLEKDDYEVQCIRMLPAVLNSLSEATMDGGAHM